MSFEASTTVMRTSNFSKLPVHFSHDRESDRRLKHSATGKRAADAASEWGSPLRVRSISRSIHRSFPAGLIPIGHFPKNPTHSLTIDETDHSRDRQCQGHGGTHQAITRIAAAFALCLVRALRNRGALGTPLADPKPRGAVQPVVIYISNLSDPT